jgi:malonyl-CoA decarboxylase
MVNYLYDPEAIVANHEAFARSGTVARSRRSMPCSPRAAFLRHRAQARTAAPAGSRVA